MKSPWNKSVFRNPGRRRLACERFRLTPEDLPAGHEEIAPIADILPLLMKKLGVEDRSWMERLTEEWALLVGKDLAVHARPGRLENMSLVVFVDNSVWLSELSRYGRRQMLSILQKRFGAERIRSIVLQLDPDPAS